MTEAPIFQTIARYGIVPVISIESPDAAIPLADALLEGGLPLAEITFRTAAAAEVMEAINLHRPELLVGAGTVLSQANVETAKKAGAAFGVAPGLNPDIVRRAAELSLPFVPGVCTPSEIEQALTLGCSVLKFFPAEQSGGIEMLKALVAPYGHTGVRFVPTGGVNLDNLEGYLKIDAVAAVGGTWIAKKEDLAGRRWQGIRDRCKAAVEIVRRARG
jgi:2-dehydro-3-deoxyphosphogluconate aldolase/(4S)-4-hydroxy-2-oxoglutarate aldolase